MKTKIKQKDGATIIVEAGITQYVGLEIVYGWAGTNAALTLDEAREVADALLAVVTEIEARPR